MFGVTASSCDGRVLRGWCCYAPRLTIGRVFNRLPWYYNVADRSSYMTGEIYTIIDIHRLQIDIQIYTIIDI